LSWSLFFCCRVVFEERWFEEGGHFSGVVLCVCVHVHSLLCACSITKQVHVTTNTYYTILGSNSIYSSACSFTDGRLGCILLVTSSTVYFHYTKHLSGNVYLAVRDTASFTVLFAAYLLSAMSCFVVRLFGTASMFEWLRNLILKHSQGSSMERWNRNTLFNVPLYF